MRPIQPARHQAVGVVKRQSRCALSFKKLRQPLDVRRHLGPMRAFCAISKKLTALTAIVSAADI